MFLKHIDLTTALRPSYLPDEVLLFVQDNVGLYEGYVIRGADMAHNTRLRPDIGSSSSQTTKMARYT